MMEVSAARTPPPFRARGPFPRNFAWGAATSAYQIEGGWEAEGRGASIWDMFSHQAGAVQEGQHGDVACDHYHRYREDVGLMRQIGLKAYRFSISWPRVLPGGTGAVNEAGLGFYDRLVDELLASKIEPWVTLYHWDLPYELFLRGGWLNSRISGWFADYTARVVDRLSDRVTHWMTLNEPQCFISLGYREGKHAPGLQMGVSEVLRAAHHALMAHGRAVQVIRERAKLPPQIGWAPCGMVHYPETDAPEDVEAARQATFGMADDSLWNNAWWFEPVYRGHYPEDGLRIYGKNLPRFAETDFETICQPLDYFGCNIYGGVATAATEDGKPERAETAQGAPLMFFPQDLGPEALYWGPKFFHERYGLPIVVAENGMAGSDWPALDGRVRDPARIDFLQRYLLALGDAIREGVPVEGYFQWSLMDNFEWVSGYRRRFGLVHVDYETQQRTLKESASWYREVIRSHGQSLAVEIGASSNGNGHRAKAEVLAG